MDAYNLFATKDTVEGFEIFVVQPNAVYVGKNVLVLLTQSVAPNFTFNTHIYIPKF